MKRIRAVVQGRVQGVGFRYFAQSLALDYCLSGWVRNLPDGNVEFEAQGPDDRIDVFAAEAQKGPPLSHVADMIVSELPLKHNERGFEIRV